MSAAEDACGPLRDKLAMVGLNPQLLFPRKNRPCTAYIIEHQSPSTIHRRITEHHSHASGPYGTIGECRRNADGALAVLGRQLRATTQHRRYVGVIVCTFKR